ncbi:uncharacterized protein [Pseudorasbora parva]|uniref:uncharacterized protein n=1 Tax=Pseudorasbora parva TaxID=51549 RepID=UPI00351F773F
MLTTSQSSADGLLVQIPEDEKLYLTEKPAECLKRSVPKMGTSGIPGKPSLLITSNGCVCVQTARPSKSYQLVEEKVQENDAGKVKVYYVNKGDVRCMAFCFEMSGKAIFPVVTDGKDVRFEELPKQEFTKDTFKEKFLFQWGEEGSEGCRSLKSVAKPSMYLFVEHQRPRVTIKPVEIPFFKIKGIFVKCL